MPSKKSYFTGTDIFLLPDGSTYHLGCKEGQIHNRILTVGSRSRARLLVQFLKDVTVELDSSRDMSVYSGTFEGKGISIIAIGMGVPMMNFMTREASFVLPKPMAIIRLGTCGIINPKLAPGTIMVASEGSIYVQTNYNYQLDCLKEGKSAEPPYFISKPIPCDAKLNDLLVEELKNANVAYGTGLNASAELFYSCQGRVMDQFDDRNEHILEQLLAKNVVSCEMESHQLFYEAFIRRIPCYTAACAIGIVNRTNEDVNNLRLTAEELCNLEKVAGLAALRALARMEI